MATGKFDPRRAPGLAIAQIFLVTASFRHREDYLSLPPTSPTGEMTIGVEGKVHTRNDGRVVALAVAVKSDPSDKNALYQFELEMMAIVGEVAEEANLLPMDFIAGSGMATLFPFLREAVANLTSRGRFGPIWLKPINVRLSVNTAKAKARGSSKSPPKSPARKK